jgi:hypothetical protein
MSRSATDHSATDAKAQALRRQDGRPAPPVPSAPLDPRSVTLDDLAGLPRRLELLEAAVSDLREKLARLAQEPAGLLTVRQFCERYGWTENQLRWLLFNRDKNGLAAAVSGSGRLLIDAACFFEVLKGYKSARRRMRRLR